MADRRALVGGPLLPSLLTSLQLLPWAMTAGGSGVPPASHGAGAPLAAAGRPSPAGRAPASALLCRDCASAGRRRADLAADPLDPFRLCSGQALAAPVPLATGLADAARITGAMTAGSSGLPAGAGPDHGPCRSSRRQPAQLPWRDPVLQGACRVPPSLPGSPLAVGVAEAWRRLPRRPDPALDPGHPAFRPGRVAAAGSPAAGAGGSAPGRRAHRRRRCRPDR